MPKRVTMFDVAREAGVSIMTVSRVVNNKEGVSVDTRKRISEIIHNLGYRPSSIARGLVTKHTGTIGLVVPDITNPFFASIARGAEHQAYAEKYSVFLANTNEDPERELAILESLEEKRVDGLLLCSSRLENEELSKWVTYHPAVVLVSRTLDEDGVGTVLIDEQLGGQMATQHLLESGHRNIGVVSGPPVSHSTRGRLKGYRQALNEVGISFNPQWIRHCSPVIEDGRETALELLEAHPDLTALFCHNDLVAVGALHACAQLNLEVPEQIAIVGFDDISLAALVTPPLTTCRVPCFELGAQAIQMLLDQINDPHEGGTQIKLQPELIVRASAPKEFIRLVHEP
jgi:LacI family transcriptional regulator